MMLSIVGLKRAFMVFGFIFSIFCEDYFIKFILWGCGIERNG